MSASISPPTLFLLLYFWQVALTTLDQRVLSKKKRLNALKHTTQTYQQSLKELKMEYQRIKPEGSNGAQSADARTRKKEEDAMVLNSQTHDKDVQNMKTTVFLSWCGESTQEINTSVFVSSEPPGAGK